MSCENAYPFLVVIDMDVTQLKLPNKLSADNDPLKFADRYHKG